MVHRAHSRILKFPVGIPSRFYRPLLACVWIFTIAAAVALTYVWRSMVNGELRLSERAAFDVEIARINREASDLRSRICWDSDMSRNGNDIFEIGIVHYLDGGGNEMSAQDECTSDGSEVFEMACSFDDEGNASPTYVSGECAKGCIDGACVK